MLSRLIVFVLLSLFGVAALAAGMNDSKAKEVVSIVDLLRDRLNSGGELDGVVSGIAALNGVSCSSAGSGGDASCSIGLPAGEVLDFRISRGENSSAGGYLLMLKMNIPEIYGKNFLGAVSEYFSDWEDFGTGVSCFFLKGSVNRNINRGVFVVMSGLTGGDGCVISSVQIVLRNSALFPMIVR